ncbi:MAG: NusG domain II-containing protein [Gammaproteobacteria bacterium]|jgi:hypothetical protein|nr:NusG domain II-containing protein [Gammaproteobacteria bacterium]
MMQARTRNPITTGDFVIVAAALLLLGWLYAQHWGGGGAAEFALVVDGSGQEMRIPLSVNRTLEIEGPLGVSVVEIDEGAARFVSSPCSNQYCVHNGWLRAGGALAACLPNRIVLALAGGDEHWDSINF